MRRRLVIAAFVLDGLCALAAPVVLGAMGPAPEAGDRYVDVGGMCIEQVELGNDEGGGIAGRPVDAALCR